MKIIVELGELGELLEKEKLGELPEKQIQNIGGSSCMFCHWIYKKGPVDYRCAVTSNKVFLMQMSCKHYESTILEYKKEDMKYEENNNWRNRIKRRLRL